MKPQEVPWSFKDQWEECMWGIQCDCGNELVMMPDYVKEDPYVCEGCGAKYWVEGHSYGKIFKCQQ